MDLFALLDAASFLWSPAVVAFLTAVAVILVWLSLSPAESLPGSRNRLEEYVQRNGMIDQIEISQSFFSRVFAPAFRRLLGFLGRLLPRRNLERTWQLLYEAGEPGKLSALDFVGLKILLAILAGGGYLFFFGASSTLSIALRNALLVSLAGYLLPQFWLKRRARKRKEEIRKALPDALDMLTVCAEAGLGLESAMLKVAAQWQNALSHEFLRAVAEMRVGTPRNVALKRMADRTGVQELKTFIAVLIQSTRLGMSIVEVLRTQAEDMRVRRRQLAEEKARKASVKMVFPLVFLIFPAMYVVILGPGIPTIISFFQRLAH